MSHIKRPDNRGQTLVIFALVMIAMLVIAALVIDGGMVYSHRRTAQAAADAAVLAGTYELCMSDNPSDAEGAAEAKALEYVTRNRASSTPIIDIVADGENRTVDVTTHISFDTFFAHLVGWPNLTAEAHAQSGCACVSAAQGVLPVAWSCRWPVNEAHPADGECLEKTVTYIQGVNQWNQTTPSDSEDTILNHGQIVYSELYVLMDTKSLDEDFLCEEDGGTMNCDLNDDGERDVYSGGNRSWLDLDGGGGPTETDWVTDGFDGEIHYHDWLAGQPGASVDVFHATQTREGDVVIVPVYDQACTTVPSNDNECAPYFHTDPPDGVNDTVVLSGGTSTDYFHIVGFASFMITCVGGPGHDLGPVNSNQGTTCPGRNLLLSSNHGEPGINAVKTIEGYFIDGPIPGAEPGSCDLGVDTNAFILQIQQ